MIGRSSSATQPTSGVKRSSEIDDLKRLVRLAPYRQRLKLKPYGAGVFKALCPWHDDHDPSLRIYEEEPHHHCFSCGFHGDVLDLIQKQDGCDFREAKRQLEELASARPAKTPSVPKGARGLGKVVATYPYTDESGSLLFEVRRYEPKAFRQRRPDGRGGYVQHLDGVRKPLYRLANVLGATEVFLVEGEKDVGTLEALELTATTVAGGASAPWLSEYGEVLKGKTVYIIPDNDAPGRKWAKRFYKELRGIAKEVVIVNLPGITEKGDVTDYVQLGHGAEDLKTLCEAQLAAANAASHQLAEQFGHSPTIQISGGSLDANVRDAELCLAQATLRNPETGVFQRGGILVQIVRQPGSRNAEGARRTDGALHIAAINSDTLALKLNQAARWERYDKRIEDWTRTDVPARVSRTLWSSPGNWPNIPMLDGVVEAPTMRADGSVLQQPGYDSITGLYFDPGDTAFPAIPELPTKADAQTSAEVLSEVIEGFPFAGEASRSVLLAAMMTPLIRPALRSAPLFLVSAPKMGSGKTLAASIPSYIATGRSPTLTSQAGSPEEEKKRLLAILLEGSVTTVIDNCERPLQSDAMCTALTEPYIRERLLGSTRTVSVSTRTTWLATGNNLTISGDLSSRALQCYLDPNCERPEERSFETDLHAEVRRRRGELAAAVLTIMRAYHCSGDSLPGLPVYGRFEDWSRLVREPLIWLGLTDPCKSRQNIEAIDAVREQLSALVEAWYAAFDDRAKTVAEALKQISDGTSLELESLNLAFRAIAGEKEPLNTKRLGHFIAKHDRRVEAGLRFERDAKRQRAQAWKVTKK